MGVAHAARILFDIVVVGGTIVFLFTERGMTILAFLSKYGGMALGFLIGGGGIIVGCLLLYSAIVDDNGARFIAACVTLAISWVILWGTWSWANDKL
jgi:hypothetical protein